MTRTGIPNGIATGSRTDPKTDRKIIARTRTRRDTTYPPGPTLSASLTPGLWLATQVVTSLPACQHPTRARGQAGDDR
jgi:hypothetical protein